MDNRDLKLVEKGMNLLNSIKSILVLVLCAILFNTCSLYVVDAEAHETDKYKHQVGSFSRYGGGFMWAGIYRTWVNAEHTQCRDLIFNHDVMHVTEPFACDENLKDLSQED